MSKTNDLKAFCRACPRVEEVSAVLQGLGFSLVFHMAAVASPASSHTPPLPAQFHYRDAHGTEVIYLAGRDAPMDGELFPAHSSRWWLSAGSDPAACQHIAQTLTEKWSLIWQTCSLDTELLRSA
jgi:hypothetical protein